MQKKLLLLLTLFVAYLTAEAQVKHVPLVEEFTQASCGPCALQNPAFNALLDQNKGSVVSLKYQTSFPGRDPMNADDPRDVSTRRSYYGVRGVPTAIVDGTYWPKGQVYTGAPYNLTQQNINTFTAKTSPISVEVSHDIDALFSTLDIKVVLKNETSSNYSVSGQKLFVAIVEQKLSWRFAPGTNGEMEFFNVMRKMLPNANGSTIKSMSAGKSETYTFSVTPPDYVHNVSELKIIAWVQNTRTKEIVQAGESTLLDATHFTLPDLDIKAETFVPADKCDYTFTPKCTVANIGSIDLDGVIVGYSLDGGQKYTTKVLSQTLLKGDEAIVEFDPVQVSEGRNLVVYSTVVPASLGKRELNDLDNIVIPPFFTLYDQTPFAEETEFDFEVPVPGLPTYPDHMYVEAHHSLANSIVYDESLGLPSGTNIGAYGKSRQCYIFFYRALPAGLDNYSTIQKMDFSRAVHAELSFDWCMGAPDNSANSLELLSSTDCGMTLESIWKESGNDLRTTIHSNTSLYVPRVAHWKNKKIDISNVAGKGEVLLRFNYVSDGDDMTIAYMDNIKIVRTQTVSTLQPLHPSIEEVSITPNPVSDQLKVDFDLSQSTVLSIGIFDSRGKKVATPASAKEYESGVHTVTWNRNGAAPGAYVLRIVGDHINISKQFVIVD